VLEPPNEKLLDRPNEVIFFFVIVIILLAKFSEFEKYLAKDGKINVYKIMKTISKYKNHTRSHSTTLRLRHRYANEYTQGYS